MFTLASIGADGRFIPVPLLKIHLGTLAAVKVLQTRLMDVDAFRTEARIVAHLIHPNIVRVLEFGIEDETPFLVMDFAPYDTLRQRHPRGERILLPLVITYVKQVAEALQQGLSTRSDSIRLDKRI